LVRVLADAVVDDDELRHELGAVLARVDQGDPPSAEPPAYTAESLAAAIGLSPKSIRNAIARGELEAVKRGGRWIVPAGAVDHGSRRRGRRALVAEERGRCALLWVVVMRRSIGRA
jgi:hypothetical protein